jgi:hypothetical protein
MVVPPLLYSYLFCAHNRSCDKKQWSTCRQSDCDQKLLFLQGVPSGRIEVDVTVPICYGTEDDLIDAASKAFKSFDKM